MTTENFIEYLTSHYYKLVDEFEYLKTSTDNKIIVRVNTSLFPKITITVYENNSKINDDPIIITGAAEIHINQFMQMQEIGIDTISLAINEIIKKTAYVFNGENINITNSKLDSLIKYLKNRGFTINSNKTIIQKVVDNDIILSVNVSTFPKNTLSVYKNGKLLSKYIEFTYEHIINMDSINVDFINESVKRILQE